MKYLLLILFIVLFIPQKSEAQGTIVDWGTYLSFNYESGDTLLVGKSQITHIRSRRNNVFLITSHYWTNDKKIPNLLIINPIDFGYVSATVLQGFLAAAFFEAYVEVYSYDNGNLDTVSYYYEDDIKYQIVYGYTGAVVTSKTIIHP